MGSRPEGTPETSERCDDFNRADGTRFQTYDRHPPVNWRAIFSGPYRTLASGTMRGLFLRRDFEPGFGSLERIKGAVNVDGRIAAREPLLGAFFGLAGAVDVDF